MRRTSYCSVRRLIRRRLTGPAHGLEAVRSAENLMGSSATVLTRTKIGRYEGDGLWRCELCFGNTKKALAQIEEQAKEILDNSAIPFMLGGEHLVTLGAFRAVLENIRYPYHSF